MNINIISVILAGGVGARLWPFSRPDMPKQFLKLGRNQTLIETTLERAKILSDKALIITNYKYVDEITKFVRNSHGIYCDVIAEPVSRNTAPAITASAIWAASQDLDSVLVVMPSDHLIDDNEKFEWTIRHAVDIAQDNVIVTVGIDPKFPSTEYGYIEISSLEEGVGKIKNFHEKPEINLANEFVQRGDFLWNAGIFVFKPKVMLDELKKFELEMFSAVHASVINAESGFGYLKLDEKFFSQCVSQSIDCAVMERTQCSCVVKAEFEWSDIGSWNEVWKNSPKSVTDNEGSENVKIGAVELEDSHGCYVRSEEGSLVAGIGLKDLVVISMPDATFIAPRDRASENKALLERLKAKGYRASLESNTVYRPWGEYTDIQEAPGYRVKYIVVKPGGVLSLQKHAKRSEHWVVVAGRGKVVRGNETFELKKNESTFIPLGEVHRLENETDQPLVMIEVQVGEYVGEDDIERLEDFYGRVS